MTNFDVWTVYGRTTLHVDSDRIEECMKYYREMKIDSLCVNPVRGYRVNNLEFLRDYVEDIKELTIVAPWAFQFDLSPVLTLSNLQSLTLSDTEPLPLNEFPQLKKFYGYWHKELNLDGCEKLELLSLSRYKSKTKDMTEFPELPSLIDLELVQTTLTSFAGISRLQRLRRLELAYLTKLETLDDVLDLPGLQVLDVLTCKKIKNAANIRALKKLRTFKLNDCGEIPTLNFINDMPALEEFRFVDTNVLDGDLTPLLKLKWVGFLNKKHYSHTSEELDAILRPKGGSAVVRLGDEPRQSI